MELITIVLTIACIALAVLCILLVILKWNAWSEDAKSGVISQLYGIGLTVYQALKNDGKIDGAELRAIFNHIVTAIAAITGLHTDVVEKQYSEKQIE
ncbi:MAG TPA: hypothetical protein O0X25_02430 [Methanocorpusculum sp.]|nr:hypothetical protein [Methanocorpusculum sp.]HJJ39973.1 hypothetical protein [Methanocorpusculum sp.]HJJ49457.1 hypothetical protein [Methanocorpusculum sp.]HJJ57008.1 hypothetical protein [Methanocorpusculum sp.]